MPGIVAVRPVGKCSRIGDGGFIFVFNPWPEGKWGSMPLNEMIGLTKGSRYSFEEISGDAPRRLGVYQKGEDVVSPISGRSAMLIELKPSAAAIDHIRVPAEASPQKAFSP